MPFFGDTVGAYLVPRAVLELLQQPDSPYQAGVCATSSFAWLLSGQQLYIWRYHEGKDARLRVLSLPRAPSPAQPPSVVLIPHGPPCPSPALPHLPSTFSGPLLPPATDGPLSVAVCDADGHLTVWLDAHHLASPVEHTLLTRTPSTPASSPLVSAFSAARLDLGSGPAFLAALSATDGSLHLLQVGAQGIHTKQLAGPAPPEAHARGLVGALGSALSRAVTDAFDPSARYLRKTPAGRPAVAGGLHVAAAPGGGGQHYRVLVLTADALDCWAVSVGLRPSEALQWSFLNTAVRTADSRRGVAAAANLALAVAGGGGGGGHPQVAVWMMESGRGDRRQHVVQLLELLPEGGPGVRSNVHEVVEGYEEPRDVAPASLRRRLLYAPHASTCLLMRWQDAPAAAAAPGGGWGFGLTAAPAAVAGGRSGRGLWLWSPTSPSGTATCVSEDPDTAAVALSDAAPAAAAGGGVPLARWVLLSATYGVVELDAAASAARRASADARGPAVAAPLAAAAGDLDPAAAAGHLLDALLSQAAAVAAAGGSLQPLVASLERRLAALGVLGTPAGEAAIARYSTQLLDLLPKQWVGSGEGGSPGEGAGGTAGGGGSVVPALLAALPGSVSEQLAEKESRHALLLQCLALSGALHALAPQVLRVLVENSEKLAVAVALHRLQAHQRDTHVAGAPPAAAALLLARLVAEAGRDSSAKEYEVLTPPEIFYARPSASVERWVAAVGRAAAEVAAQAAGGLGQRGDADLSSLRGTVRELGSLVGLLVGAAVGRREGLAAQHRLAAAEVAARLGSPDWLAGQGTREALEQLARAIQAVRPPPPPPSGPPAPLPAPELSHSLYGVTDVLLTCFASAVAATRNDPSTRAALMAAYRTARTALLDDLLADAVAELRAAAVAGAGAGGLGGGAQAPGQQQWGALPPDLLIWQVEALSRAHHCYAHLFDSCEALAHVAAAAGQPAAAAAALSRLHAYMATQPPEEGAPPDAPGLCRHVFGRLLEGGRPADLLDLPAQFHEGITQFLQSLHPAHSDLLALHLLRTGQLPDAAAVLQQAGAKGQVQGQQGGSVLGSSRRQLALARLAARAGGAGGVEGGCVLQLRLLELQGRLGLSPDGPPLEPAVLLEEALAAAAAPARGGGDTARAKEAAVVAVEVLALMAAEERNAHGSKWQQAWRAAFEADPWDGVAAARAEAAGGSDGTAAAAVAATAVYRAAAACAGSDVLGFGASVVDSAPLDQVARWLRTWALGAAAGGARSPGGGAAAAAAGDVAAQRRVDSVMAALRMGVEGQRQQQLGTGAGVEGGAAEDFMVVE